MWDSPGLLSLESNTHCSAVLHENELGALLIPNPNADIPVSTKLFPFAQIAESPDVLWVGGIEMEVYLSDAVAAAD